MKRNIIKNKLTFNDYKNCIDEKKVYRYAFNNIRTYNHELVSQTFNKIVLVAYGDKRYLLNPYRILSFGHFLIEKNLG